MLVALFLSSADLTVTDSSEGASALKLVAPISGLWDLCR